MITTEKNRATHACESYRKIFQAYNEYQLFYTPLLTKKFNKKEE